MTATPAHLYELGDSMAGDGVSLRVILRALLDEGATDLDLVRVTKRIERVSFKRARELIDASGLVTPSPKQVTIIVPADDPWYGKIFPVKSSDEDIREEFLYDAVEAALPQKKTRESGSTATGGWFIRTLMIPGGRRSYQRPRSLRQWYGWMNFSGTSRMRNR